ncbi:tetratricopeptide repeat protein [Azospirillum agricola]|uniref:tetratricopeptide repeat-containing glycosyltransferase family protein n=1 Tax=Azospirillum agricola TaxID=1720247 RepID=UPI000A0F0624|nr:tetratricopeptide repeat-containing glycosyltransferase family protein [Azospirillum agricola]SMH33495.1 Tetratricopeptide (TPR) repeat [Azospirillum lipoferum]
MATIHEALLIALDHHRAGRLNDAATLYRRVLEADSGQPDAWQFLGVLHAQSGRAATGRAMLHRAAALRPDGAGTHSNLAGVLQTLGESAAAEASYRRTLRLAPTLADAHAGRASALRALSRADMARDSAIRALALEPAHGEALANAADALLACHQPDDAEAAARRALRMRPDLTAAWMTLGSALTMADRWEEAVPAYRTALALDPRYGEAWENWAALLAKLGRFGESLAGFDRAEALRPSPLLWVTRGIAKMAMARPAEALTDFDRALESRPDDSGLRWNRGFARLLIGDYAGAWPEVEHRRADTRTELPWRTFPQPTWRGEDVAGRTLLLYAEQGFGDTLQFVRYAPLAAARGARVLLEVQPQLVRLLSGLPGVERVFGRGEPLPDFDLECPLMSLPRAFATEPDSVPAAPYLRPDPAQARRWRDRIGDGEALKVGLVWAGNPRFPGDRLRSPRLEGMRAVLDVPGVRVFGLQAGPGRADLEGADLPPGFTDLGPELKDFTDTAAIMANLDLVISSCTAPAHLAGALGVPLWVVLPFSPDWRWLLDREDSPWYPTARLFRQTRVGDWASVGRRVADALRYRQAERQPAD